eukprot:TRINITY_DN67797_c1_g2_i11.p2 TRINITY_DN67797_c1_g2~~TRINITY_DN67797_c1_g2_i11.p2  ORF type:complete len:133 (-),score=1.58 TRINITY_DN67797_c1_g2_i11:1159-1557(-)
MSMGVLAMAALVLGHTWTVSKARKASCRASLNKLWASPQEREESLMLVHTHLVRWPGLVMEIMWLGGLSKPSLASFQAAGFQAAVQCCLGGGQLSLAGVGPPHASDEQQRGLSVAFLFPLVALLAHHLFCGC